MKNRNILAARAACIVTLVAGATLIPELRAVPPSQQLRDEAAGSSTRNFVPNAGYAAAARAQLLERRRLEATGAPGMMLAPTPFTALTGRRMIPVICVKFANSPDADPFPPLRLEDALFDKIPRTGPRRPTLTQYYCDMSNDQFQPSGVVKGWFGLPQSDTYYEGATNGMGPDDPTAHLGEFVRDCLIEADASINFSDYDNDGPDGEPNSGDDDGVVDTLFIVHPERGGECRNTNLWSHSFNYQFLDAGGRAFRTNDARKNSRGEEIPGEKIMIDDYTLQPGLACGSEDTMIPIGVFCHEYGHALGLPDLYDRTPRTKKGPNSEGVGNYCCMAGGSYGADGRTASRPVQLSAWAKAYLGWANIQKVLSSGEVVLRPVQEANDILCIDVPNTSGREYFLIEYRPSTWTDRFAEKLNWDRDFGTDGLFIWHVDERVGEDSPDWPFAQDDKGQNDTPSLPMGDRFDKKYSLVALVQADRKLDLERRRNRGETSDHVHDLFNTGEDFGDDPELLCGSRSYLSEATGIRISGIRPEKHSLSAFITVGPAIPRDALTDSGNRNPAPTRGPASTPADPGDSSEGRAEDGQDGPADGVTSHSATRLEIASALEPNEEQVTILSKLQEVETRLSQCGANGLSGAECELLEKTPSELIEYSFSAGNVAEALRIGGGDRIHSLEEIAAKHDPLNAALASLAERSEGTDETTKVQFSTDHKRVERITGLNVDGEGKDLEKNAHELIAETLTPILGEDLQLKARPQEEGEASVTFDQVLKVQGKSVTLDQNEVKLIFNEEGALASVENKTIEPASLTVVGSPGELSANQAKEIVSETLAIPPSLIKKATEVLHIDPLSPDKARFVQKVEVISPGKGRNVDVIVDSKTKVILPIRGGK